MHQKKQEFPSVFTVRMVFFLTHFALLGHFCVVKTNSPSNSGQSKQAIGVKIVNCKSVIVNLGRGSSFKGSDSHALTCTHGQNFRTVK